MSQGLDTAAQPGRILIVDDDRQNRQLLEVMLAPEGFELVSAASGEEALTIVAQEPPDLILLDIMMPGMDGFEFAARIKGSATTKNIPVIMVTALDDRASRIHGLSVGAEEFLTKPVDRVELCARVRNLSRLKTQGDDTYHEMLEGKVGTRTAELVTRTHSLEQQAAVLREQAALLDLAQDAIVVRDMNSRILFWSRGAEVMYGWPSSEVLGREVAEVQKPEVSEPTAEIEATLLSRGQWEGESIHHRRDGTRLNVASRSALQRDVDGTPSRILTINNDITDRKRAEAELLLLTERLSLANAVAKVGVWEWELASNTLTWDATMFAIYGCAPTVPMPYDRWTAAVFPDDLPGVEATLRQAVREKGEGCAEFRIIRPDGTVRNVSAVERVVVDAGSNVSRVIGVNMDVTERVQAERALEQLRAGQLRFKDDFLSHVSHELRSPLTAIKQFTSILLSGIAGELTPEQREYQQIVLRNIRQLQSMIDDLLEVTRLETGKLTVEAESVEVVSAVRDTFNTLHGAARAKGVTLSSDLPEDLPAVYADPTRLRQILIILLDNAIKFTPKGGAVSVRASREEQDDGGVLVEVSDTGCGITPEVAGRLFERLYQVAEPEHASRKGLGLGLYICKELVTRQGGRIWATRRPESGSTFSFTLPSFSLDSLIAPLFKNGQWPAESVALVTVEVLMRMTWPSKEAREEWTNEARSLLQRCFLPNLDVLLPTMNSDAHGERYVAAAFADDNGAAVLANRIRGQLFRYFDLKHPDLTFAVSYSMLPPLSQEVNASDEGTVARMAAHLANSIKTHTIPAVVHHA